MNTHHIQTDKSGFSVLATLCIMLVFSGFLSILVFSSGQRAETTRRLTNRIKAQAISEAGCEYAYAMLSTDWESRNDPNAFSSGGGYGQTSYTLEVNPVGDDAVVVKSWGYSGTEQILSVISVRDTSGAGSSDSGTGVGDVGFDYAILSGDAISMVGNSIMTTTGGPAKFHAQNDFLLEGNTHELIDISSCKKIIPKPDVVVGGNVSAPLVSNVPGAATVLGTVTLGSVPPVAIPDIDLTPYYNYALEHGEVHDFGFVTDQTYTPVGGIMWVNGMVDLNDGAYINGSIIATSNFKINGSATVAPTTSNIGIISRDGKIETNGSGTITGLVYAPNGGLKKFGDTQIHGQLIIGGKLQQSGNGKIVAGFTKCVPSLPGTITVTDFISVNAWQK